MQCCVFGRRLVKFDMTFYSILRKILFLFNPETSHRLTLALLKSVNTLHLTRFYPTIPSTPSTDSKPIKVMGLTFPNRVGIAAGFDKNGEAIDAIMALGIGFVEVGTVTPKPQPGNPKPRLFRLVNDQALINHLGFNNGGLDLVVANLRKQKKRAESRGVLGISITQNNDTAFENAIDDYINCYEKVYRYTDYVGIDISCPNVPGKQSLETGEKFSELLQTLKLKQNELTQKFKKKVPIVIKIGPDLTEHDLINIAKEIKRQAIDGVIATNTTTSRPADLTDPDASKKGGLSGKPLFPLTLKVVKRLHQILGEEIPIIAVGGIDSVQAAKQMFDAGASLVQIYTGFVYRGPKLIQDIVGMDGVRSRAEIT